jgi:hypothetical protein
VLPKILDHTLTAEVKVDQASVSRVPSQSTASASWVFVQEVAKNTPTMLLSNDAIKSKIIYV